MIGLKSILLSLPFWICQQTEIVTLNVQKLVIKAGKHEKIRVDVKIKDGFHIQANKLQNEFLIPTTLKIVAHNNLKTGKQFFPPVKRFRLQGTSDSLDVFDGSFEISIPVKASKNIKEGNYNLQAEFRYQACDERICFFPKTIEFSIPVQVVAK